MSKIAVVGAGGFGREVAALLADLDGVSFAGFLDDAVEPGTLVLGWGPVLGGIEEADRSDCSAVIAVGHPQTRKEIAGRLGLATAMPIIHPNAWVGPMVEFGSGSVVCSGVSITTNIRIGSHVHLNLHATVGHDSVIGDFVTVSPGVCISGNSHIGNGVEIGTSATILPGVSLGERAVVGAGAVVTKDVAGGTTVVGIPARPL